MCSEPHMLREVLQDGSFVMLKGHKNRASGKELLYDITRGNGLVDTLQDQVEDQPKAHLELMRRILGSTKG